LERLGENQVNRGDVYWYKFRRPDKERPVVVLTRDSSIPLLNSVVVAAVTTTLHQAPSEVIIGPEDGLPSRCAVNLHHIHYANKNGFGKWITRLSKERMAKIRGAIMYSLQLGGPE
jgi:mRNA interferase MazF